MIIPMPVEIPSTRTMTESVGEYQSREALFPEVKTLLGWVVRDARSPLVLDMISKDEVFR